jgi:hypothetical protein
MRFFNIPILCAAIVNAVSSLNFTDKSWNGIAAGKPVELTWQGNIGAVNITLNHGTMEDAHIVGVIASQTPPLCFKQG